MSKPNAIASGARPIEAPATAFIRDEAEVLDDLEAFARRDLESNPGRIEEASRWWRSCLHRDLQSFGQPHESQNESSGRHPIEGAIDDMRRIVLECIDAADRDADESERIARELIAVQSAVARGGTEYSKDSSQETIADAIARSVEQEADTDIIAATVHHPEVRSRFTEAEVLGAMTPAERVEWLHCTLAATLHGVLSRAPRYYPAQDEQKLSEGVSRLTQEVTRRIVGANDNDTVPFPRLVRAEVA